MLERSLRRIDNASDRLAGWCATCSTYPGSALATCRFAFAPWK